MVKDGGTAHEDMNQKLAHQPRQASLAARRGGSKERCYISASSSVRERDSNVHMGSKWTVREQAPALFMGSQQAAHRKNAPTGNPPSLPGTA